MPTHTQSNDRSVSVTTANFIFAFCRRDLTDEEIYSLDAIFSALSSNSSIRERVNEVLNKDSQYKFAGKTVDLSPGRKLTDVKVSLPRRRG